MTDRTPLAGAVEIMTATAVQVSFNEAMNPASLTAASFTLTPAGGSALAAQVSYEGMTRTATLTPAAELAYATTYEARVTTAATDLAGNPLAFDETWSFTTQLIEPDCLTTTTTDQYAAGTLSGVMVAETDNSAGGGQLRLQAEASDLFLSPTLDSAWVVTRGGSQPVISNGVLEGQIYAAGTPVTSAMEMTTTYGDGTACETRALIQPGSNFSSIGFFSSTGTSVQWAYFSTFGTGDDPVPVIHTVVRDTSGAIVGVPTAVTLDQWHDLRVVLLPGAVEFWADGVLIDTRNDVGLTLPQRFGSTSPAARAPRC